MQQAIVAETGNQEPFPVARSSADQPTLPEAIAGDRNRTASPLTSGTGSSLPTSEGRSDR